MKFRVDRDALAESVAWAARSLPTRPSVPVLAGLLLDATSLQGQAELRLSGFDYETSARATLPAEVVDEGKALVSGRLLADICRALPAHQVELALDGQRVSLVCGSARFTLQTMPVEDYPALPGMPEQAGTVPSAAFAHSVAQAVSAAGRDDMLPLLTGVRVEVQGARISMMATDRFRASLVELDWSPQRTDVERQALIPARVLNDTAKSLTSGPEVGVALPDPAAAEGLIGFQGEVGGGSRRTTTRLLDGEFPRVRQLFASDPTTQVWVETRGAGRVAAPGGAGGRAQHPGPAGLRARAGAARGGQRRRGAGVGVAGRAPERRAAVHRLQPRATCSTGSASSTPRGATSPSPSRPGRSRSPVRPRRVATPISRSATC